MCSAPIKMNVLQSNSGIVNNANLVRIFFDVQMALFSSWVDAEAFSSERQDLLSSFQEL